MIVAARARDSTEAHPLVALAYLIVTRRVIERAVRNASTANAPVGSVYRCLRFRAIDRFVTSHAFLSTHAAFVHPLTDAV